MPRRLATTFALVLAGAALTVGCAAAPTTTTPPATTPSATGGDATGGAALLEAKCQQCHGLDRVDAVKADRETWVETIKRMRANGLKIEDSEVEELASYLSTR